MPGYENHLPKESDVIREIHFYWMGHPIFVPVEMQYGL
jgi:hypothetical protein